MLNSILGDRERFKIGGRARRRPLAQGRPARVRKAAVESARAVWFLRSFQGRAFLPVDDGPAVGGGRVVLGRVRGADEELVISRSLLPTRVVAVPQRWRIASARWRGGGRSPRPSLIIV